MRANAGETTLAPSFEPNHIPHMPALVRITAISVFLLLLVATPALAQRGRGGFTRLEPNAPYTGQFTFVRLRYGGFPAGWAFDYPAMERNFMSVLGDLTTINPRARQSNVLDMDDPQLQYFPVAYLSEPGYWYPTDSEAAGLRTWLLKGGFLIVDDFYGFQWQQFERAMAQVLPRARPIRLDVTHPVFHAFFSLSTLDGLHHPASRAYAAEYYGIFEDNDPTKRLMVIVNFNNDIGDYMEWSAGGWYPVNLTNDAYKLATNYLVYAMTH